MRLSLIGCVGYAAGLWSIWWQVLLSYMPSCWSLKHQVITSVTLLSASLHAIVYLHHRYCQFAYYITNHLLLPISIFIFLFYRVAQKSKTTLKCLRWYLAHFGSLFFGTHLSTLFSSLCKIKWRPLVNEKHLKHHRLKISTDYHNKSTSLWRHRSKNWHKERKKWSRECNETNAAGFC